MTGLFIPEILTPLAFTPLYVELSDDEKLSYNHAHGRYFLEQTIFFEQLLGKPVLQKLIQLAPDEAIAEIARSSMDEEDRHTGWFRGLLREVEPETYNSTDFHLLEVKPMVPPVARMLGRSVNLLPFLLWLQLIAEERSLYFGVQFIKAAGEIDERFLAVQRQHLTDEAGHIRNDEIFIDWLWPRCGRPLRRLNARLLEWSLRELFYLPKRSGWRVVDHWLHRHPNLLPRRDEFRSTMAALADNDRFLLTLYPRRHLPRTCALAARWPEMQFLEDFFTDDV